MAKKKAVKKAVTKKKTQTYRMKEVLSGAGFVVEKETGKSFKVAVKGNADKSKRRFTLSFTSGLQGSLKPAAVGDLLVAVGRGMIQNVETGQKEVMISNKAQPNQTAPAPLTQQ